MSLQHFCFHFYILKCKSLSFVSFLFFLRIKMRVKTNEAMFDIKDDVMDSEKMDTKADPVSH